MEHSHNTEVFKYNPCDYNNAYILVRRDITIIALKNCASFP